MAQDANEVHAQLLYDLLTKEAADDGPGTEATTEGENPYSVDDAGAEQRPEGTIDSPWGESSSPDKKEPGQVVPLSKEVLQAVRQGREELLGKLLVDKTKSDKADQALIRQHFGVPFESNSPQLSSSNQAHSLVDRIRQVAGRH